MVKRMDITELKQLVEQNELFKSLEILNERIQFNSVDIPALQLRGRIHYKMQKWGDAMNDFSSVLELEPDNAEAKSGLQMAKNILGYFTPDMFNP
jgi:regulator of sirC expression with transglutaminase-like and TPR domain